MQVLDSTTQWLAVYLRMCSPSSLSVLYKSVLLLIKVIFIIKNIRSAWPSEEHVCNASCRWRTRRTSLLWSFFKLSRNWIITALQRLLQLLNHLNTRKLHHNTLAHTSFKMAQFLSERTWPSFHILHFPKPKSQLGFCLAAKKWNKSWKATDTWQDEIKRVTAGIAQPSGLRPVLYSLQTYGRCCTAFRLTAGIV